MEILIAGKRIDARAKCATCGFIIDAKENTHKPENISEEHLMRLGAVICKYCQPSQPDKKIVKIFQNHERRN